MNKQAKLRIKHYLLICMLIGLTGCTSKDNSNPQQSGEILLSPSDIINDTTSLQLDNSQTVEPLERLSLRIPEDELLITIDYQSTDSETLLRQPAFNIAEDRYFFLTLPLSSQFTETLLISKFGLNLGQLNILPVETNLKPVGDYTLSVMNSVLMGLKDELLLFRVLSDAPTNLAEQATRSAYVRELEESIENFQQTIRLIDDAVVFNSPVRHPDHDTVVIDSETLKISDSLLHTLISRFKEQSVFFDGTFDDHSVDDLTAFDQIFTVAKERFQTVEGIFAIGSLDFLFTSTGNRSIELFRIQQALGLIKASFVPSILANHLSFLTMASNQEYLEQTLSVLLAASEEIGVDTSFLYKNAVTEIANLTALSNPFLNET